MATPPLGRIGLRERKKTRTRETVVRVALDLFTLHGFRATTLAQIAEAAEIAPSTLYSYFPCKEDIIFEHYDATRESVRTRILERPPSETVIEAVTDWIAIARTNPRVGSVEASEGRRRAIIDGDAELLASERLRLAFIEDDLAEAFAHDFAGSPDDLRSRLMASLVVNSLVSIWRWWFPRQRSGDLDTDDLAQLDMTYIIKLVEAAEAAFTAMPNGPGRQRWGSSSVGCRQEYAVPVPGISHIVERKPE